MRVLQNFFHCLTRAAGHARVRKELGDLEFGVLRVHSVTSASNSARFSNREGSVANQIFSQVREPGSCDESVHI